MLKMPLMYSKDTNLYSKATTFVLKDTQIIWPHIVCAWSISFAASYASFIFLLLHLFQMSLKLLCPFLFLPLLTAIVLFPFVHFFSSICIFFIWQFFNNQIPFAHIFLVQSYIRLEFQPTHPLWVVFYQSLEEVKLNKTAVLLYGLVTVNLGRKDDEMYRNTSFTTGRYDHNFNLFSTLIGHFWIVFDSFYWFL